MTRREWKQLGKGLAFVSPWIVGFGLFTALPIVLSLYYSFCEYPLLQKPVFIGLENYAELLWQRDPANPGQFGDPVFYNALYNTFRYAAMALPAGLMVSLGLALLLNVRTPGQAVYRTIIFLPSLVPMVASAILWMWIFNGKDGLINGVLRFAGISQPPSWLESTTWAMPSLAIMSLWGVGNTVVIYLAGLQDVPAELYDAAEIDGAGPWRRLWHVTIPMISPVIFFNLIMAIIGTMQVFATPYIMTGGGPERSTHFFTMYLYDNAFMYLKMGYASAMAWIQLVIILILTGLAFWLSRRFVHYQGK